MSATPAVAVRGMMIPFAMVGRGWTILLDDLRRRVDAAVHSDVCQLRLAAPDEQRALIRATVDQAVVGPGRGAERITIEAAAPSHAPADHGMLHTIGRTRTGLRWWRVNPGPSEPSRGAGVLPPSDGRAARTAAVAAV